MAHQIHSVEPGGIADQCGLRPGDTLLAINGEAVVDQIDYQYLTASEALVLTVATKDGVSEIELEKDAEEPLGITLDSTLMSRPRICANRCVFCFIDQMPPGLRKTLYVKDDDWRLSLMMGNYITLTNLSDKEFDRLIARKASPLYISIHATDGAVRARMMGNKRAATIMDQLARLRDAGICFHGQIVLCPGLNDGPVLDETLSRLASMHPAALSVALVPVGLTCHRDGQCALTPYDSASATRLLGQVTRWQKRLLETLGTRFVFPADEFFCLSGSPLPEAFEYEGFPQIENGVGMLRGFADEFISAREHADASETKPRRVLIATGTSAAPFLRELIEKHPVQGITADVMAVENRFFGSAVTVAGLLVGGDLRGALSGVRGLYDEVLISQAMLRHEGERFLDDEDRLSLQHAIGVPVHAVDCDGAAFLYALQGDLYGPED